MEMRGLVIKNKAKVAIHKQQEKISNILKCYEWLPIISINLTKILLF